MFLAKQRWWLEVKKSNIEESICRRVLSCMNNPTSVFACFLNYSVLVPDRKTNTRSYAIEVVVKNCMLSTHYSSERVKATDIKPSGVCSSSTSCLMGTLRWALCGRPLYETKVTMFWTFLYCAGVHCNSFVCLFRCWKLLKMKSSFKWLWRSMEVEWICLSISTGSRLQMKLFVVTCLVRWNNCSSLRVILLPLATGWYNLNPLVTASLMVCSFQLTALTTRKQYYFRSNFP